MGWVAIRLLTVILTLGTMFFLCSKYPQTMTFIFIIIGSGSLTYFLGATLLWTLEDLEK